MVTPPIGRFAACLLAVYLARAPFLAAQVAEPPAYRPREPERPKTGILVIAVIERQPEADYQPGSTSRVRLWDPGKAMRAVVEYARLTPDLDLQPQVRPGRFDQQSLAGAALVYWAGANEVLSPSDAEKEALGTYLTSGGLLFADDVRAGEPETGLEGTDAGVAGTPFDRQLKTLLADPLVLGEAGRRWEPIPPAHPLYHGPYDFPDGPPRGGAPYGNVAGLEMLQVRGRPVVIFSDLNIGWYWGDPTADSRGRGLQFGVNLMWLARTQRLHP